MTRKDLIKRVVIDLRNNDIRKPVCARKHTLHISDDEGNKKDIVVKDGESNLLFTEEDIEYVIESCITVIEDALRHGEDITVRGFGSLGLRYRKARTTKHPVTREEVDVQARFVPKFIFGNDLRTCAKVYALSLGEKLNSLPPVYDEDDDFDEDDDL